MSTKRKIDTCGICVDVQLTISRICTCPYCNFTCCQGCVRTYLLGQTGDASCMNCNKAWPYSVLSSLLPKSFLNKEYRVHRSSILYEREMAMMPATQPYVVQELQRRENEKLLSQLMEERNRLRQRLRELERSFWVLQGQTLPPLEERRAFNHKCGRDGCRGFLSSQWKCSVCDSTTCSECGEVKEDGHVCNPSSRESFEMIKRECRKCPSCATYIHKIDGCDQMWCTGCKTAFSWRTGRQITGNFHNPHYVQYMQSQRTLARDLNDIPCGARPTYQELVMCFGSRGHPQSVELTELLSFCRLVMHIDQEIRPGYPVDFTTEALNRSLRVKYSLNECSQDEMKRKLATYERAQLKKHDVGMIITMFINVMDDLLRQSVVNRQIVQIIREMHALVGYTNSEMLKVSKVFKCVVPIISRRGSRPCGLDCYNRSLSANPELTSATWPYKSLVVDIGSSSSD